MKETDRQALISLERAKARRFLAQAAEMCRQGLWDLAANRFYYASFHEVQALFLKEGISGHTHSGMVSQFSVHYVKTGRVEASFGSFLARMMQLRQKADYNCAYEISEQEVKDIAPMAAAFVDELEKMFV